LPATAEVPGFAAPYVRRFAEILDVVGMLDGFALVPVEVRPRAVIRAMADWIRQQQRRVHVVDLKDAEWRMLCDTLFSLQTRPETIVVLVGTGENTSDLRMGLHFVNTKRDSLARHLGCPLLWCGPPEFLNLTGEQAPDFWSIREIPQRIDVEPDGSAPVIPMPSLVEATAPPAEIRLLFEAAKAQKDWPNTARLGLRLARALAGGNKMDEAQAAATDARALFEEMQGGRGAKGAAECEEVLGDVARATGNVEASWAHYTKMLRAGEQLGDEHLTARAYHRQGMAAQAERDLDKAARLYKKALGLLGMLGDEHSTARTYDDLARIAWERRAIVAAEASSKEALARFEKLGDAHSAAVSYVRLGWIAKARLEFDAAKVCYEKARVMFEDLRDEHGVAETYFFQGEAAYENKDLAAAKACYEKALAWFSSDPSASERLRDIHERLHEIEMTLRNRAATDGWRPKARTMAIRAKALIQRLWGQAIAILFLS
jgi:tetratricopeptide (TPR) repeat protein